MKFVKHYDKNYTTISNEIIRDKNVSNAAKGLFLFLWSCSDEFHITVRGLQAILKDGTRAICSQLDELKKAGYLRASQQSKGGTFEKVQYDLRDNLKTPFEETEQACLRNAYTQNAYTQNAYTQNADAKEILNKEVLREEPYSTSSSHSANTQYSTSQSHQDTKPKEQNKQINKEFDDEERKPFEIPTSWDTQDYAFRKCGDMSIGNEFFWYYFHRNWHINGDRIRDWRALLDSWIAKKKREGDEDDEHKPFHIPHYRDPIENYDFERGCWRS